MDTNKKFNAIYVHVDANQISMLKIVNGTIKEFAQNLTKSDLNVKLNEKQLKNGLKVIYHGFKVNGMNNHFLMKFFKLVILGDVYIIKDDPTHTSKITMNELKLILPKQTYNTVLCDRCKQRKFNESETCIKIAMKTQCQICNKINYCSHHSHKLCSFCKTYYGK